MAHGCTFLMRGRVAMSGPRRPNPQPGGSRLWPVGLVPLALGAGALFKSAPYWDDVFHHSSSGKGDLGFGLVVFLVLALGLSLIGAIGVIGGLYLIFALSGGRPPSTERGPRASVPTEPCPACHAPNRFRPGALRICVRCGARDI
jgi:hypothetical protein